jgi:hypothetical protein
MNNSNHHNLNPNSMNPNSVNEESPAGEVRALSRPNSMSALRRTRTKILLGVVAILSAVLVSGVTRSNQGQMEVGSAAFADASAASMLSSEVTRPAPDIKVFHQSMPVYHWHTDCPLADAKSLRPDHNSTPVARQFMSQEQAEKRHLLPCVYCADFVVKKDNCKAKYLRPAVSAAIILSRRFCISCSVFYLISINTDFLFERLAHGNKQRQKIFIVFKKRLSVQQAHSV